MPKKVVNSSTIIIAAEMTGVTDGANMETATAIVVEIWRDIGQRTAKTGKNDGRTVN
jgi:hypothetical protein